MPRPDGKLYPSEVDAIRAEQEKDKPAKPRKRMGRPPGSGKVKQELEPMPKIEPDKLTVELEPKEKRKPGPAPIVKFEVERAVELLKPRDALGVFGNGRKGAKSLKINAEVIRDIVQSIRGGMSIDKSCVLHGIHSSYLDKWKRANPELMECFRQAELEDESQLVAVVRSAAGKDWKAGNWLLERRHDWLPPAQRVEQSGTVHHLTIHKSLLGGIGKLNEPGSIEVQARKVS
jgi:hypothetical protein